MYQPLLPFDFERPKPVFEPKGVVFTKPWVVEFLLDLAGYVETGNLVDVIAVEPAAGHGAFLVPMAQRLIRSCHRQGRPITDCFNSLISYELDDLSAEKARNAVVTALEKIGITQALAEQFAGSWIRSGDYLLDAFHLPRADYLIGNPPYVRLEDIPPETVSVLLQLEMEKRHARVILQLGRSFSDAKATQELHAP